ncbi:hypothetical protein [Emticicia sp. SJ17W-69]
MKKDNVKNTQIAELKNQIEKLKSENRIRIFISILINVLDKFFQDWQ